MKKFILLIIGVAVLVSVSSCREADEWTTTATANIENNTTNTVSESTTGDTNNSTSDEDSDPPKKDEIKW